MTVAAKPLTKTQAVVCCCNCCLQALKSQGIVSAFDAKTADFSKISEDPVFATSVLQSVGILRVWLEIAC